jgi:hypothetical protein
MVDTQPMGMHEAYLNLRSLDGILGVDLLEEL